ncbi:MAG: hypothetical protein U5L95_00600 [Candidatus Saccharibacteria bacterium]|nr:hypothetical protein [Candidatus Saccharibacteria bacterium]
MATSKKQPSKAKTTTKTKTKTSRASTARKSTKKPAKKTAAKKTTAKTTAKKSAATAKGKKTAPVKDAFMQLKKLHVFLGLLMAVLAGFLFSYGNDAVVGINSSYLAENTLTETGSLLPAATELFAVNLLYVAAGVLIAGALWHAALSTRLFARYSAQVKNKFTSLNWVEHAVFGPLVIAVIAAAVGVRDVMTLLLLASIPAFTAVLGYLTDRYNLIGRSTRLKQKIAIEALLLPWVIIGISILHTYLYGFVTLSASVYALLAAGFLAYLALGQVHRQQITKSGSLGKDFIAAEKVIVVLQATLLVVLSLIFFV